MRPRAGWSCRPGQTVVSWFAIQPEPAYDTLVECVKPKETPGIVFEAAEQAVYRRAEILRSRVEGLRRPDRADRQLK